MSCRAIIDAFNISIANAKVSRASLTKGTYITITDKEVQGRVLFIPGKKSELATVKALKTRGSFGGVITQIYLVYEDTKAGKKLPDRGLTSKDMLPKKDLQELLRTIHQTNPHIEIPEELQKLI